MTFEATSLLKGYYDTLEKEFEKSSKRLSLNSYEKKEWQYHLTKTLRKL